MGSRDVAVMTMDADDGKIMMVVVCSKPSEAYITKDQNNIGFIEDGKFKPKNKSMSLSENE